MNKQAARHFAIATPQAGTVFGEANRQSSFPSKASHVRQAGGLRASGAARFCVLQGAVVALHILKGTLCPVCLDYAIA